MRVFRPKDDSFLTILRYVMHDERFEFSEVNIIY